MCHPLDVIAPLVPINAALLSVSSVNWVSREPSWSFQSTLIVAPWRHTAPLPCSSAIARSHQMLTLATRYEDSEVDLGEDDEEDDEEEEEEDEEDDGEEEANGKPA